MDQIYTEPVQEQWRLNPDYQRLSTFLGVDSHDRGDYKLAQKINYLRDWGSENGTKSVIDAMSTLNGLRKSLGYNTMGRTLVDALYQNVRLKQDMSRQKQEVKVTTNEQIRENIDKENTAKKIAHGNTGSIDQVVKREMANMAKAQEQAKQVMKREMANIAKTQEKIKQRVIENVTKQVEKAMGKGIRI